MKLQSYLYDDRNISIPVPTNVPEWTRVSESNVTSETKGILDKLVSKVHEVSLFSWHPNIQNAQYSEGKGFAGWGNYNSRISLGDSIIVKGFDKTLENDGYDFIRDSLNHIPEVKTCGGSGNREDGLKTYRSQLSFLHTVGTHDESNDLKNRLITHGAYSFFDGEWWYIPAHLFNPYLEDERIVKEKGEELRSIYKHHPDVEFLEISNSLTSKIVNDKKEYYLAVRIRTSKLTQHVHVFKDSYIIHKVPGIPTVPNAKSVNLKSVLESFENFTDEEIDLLVANPKDCKKILHPHRGKVAARNFNF